MSPTRRQFLALASAATVSAALPLGRPVARARAESPDYPSWVYPIRWSECTVGQPGDAAALLCRDVLRNAVRYQVGTWFGLRFGTQTGRYLNLGGTAEQNVRPPGGAALGLAVLLATGSYDNDVTSSRDIAVRLVASLAYRHTANQLGGGWGDDWQTALWASDAGLAGWLLWDDLAPDDRLLVERMVTHEADRFLDYQVPYYQRPDGTVVTPGDSKAEENAWNATLLNLAVAMMPDHPDAPAWQAKALELMVSAYSRPSDLTNATMLNGKRVQDWLHGSDIFDDGTLVNHGIIHPDYMASITQITSAPLAYALAGQPTPCAAFFNADLVYGALVDKQFASPPYAAPGGTIFRTDAYGQATSDVYYPQGNDWGTARRMHFGLIDTEAAVFGFDSRASVPAADWASAHVGQVYAMQGRFSDGRTYGATSEDTYAGREQWVAQIAARAYLAHWVSYQGIVDVSDRAYPARPPGVTLQTVAPAYFVTGAAADVEVTVTNSRELPMLRPAVQLALPDVWSAVPGEPLPSVLAPGTSASSHWTVTPGTSGTKLRTTVTYSQLGGLRLSFQSTPVAVAPPPPSGTAWLSDLDWMSVNAAYPPRRDVNNFGEPLSLKGVTYAKGLWLDDGYVEYYLGGWSGHFVADLGIDDAIARRYGAGLGSVTFEVWLDGTKVFDSGLVTGASAVVHLDLTVDGAQVLRLVVTDGGDGRSYDWGDWAGAQLVAT